MVRSFLTTACVISACFCSTVSAQSAYDLLPETTQGVVLVPNGNLLLEQWKKTQLSKLLDDESVAPFFEEQRQEIQQRLMEAGWRLSVKPQDISQYATGQLAFAWTTKEGTPLKPFALALIADVEDDPAATESMLETIEEQLDPRQTAKEVLSYREVAINKYSLPPRAGELIARDSFLAVHHGLLLVSDDEALLKQMLDRAAGAAEGRQILSSDETFVRGRELANVTDSAQIEYFIRPLGFARVIRSIGGQRSKSSADILTVLENQGFGAIKCVCGEIKLGQTELDIEHHGYVYAQRPLPQSAGILDFPNAAKRSVPNFVGSNVASFVTANWNAQEAFWKVSGLVDELAGTEGVFDEVIEGIKKDPNGPRIDIKADVLPLLTNDIFAITDNKQGEADVDSRRNLIALKIHDPAAMSRVLNKAMQGEPDAELVEFEGVNIWQVVRREVDEFSAEGLDDFGDFGDPIETAPVQSEPEPWLSNWAITVYGEYLMFASHVELIQESIGQAQASQESSFAETRDYQRVMTALATLFGDGDASMWRILRPEKAFRVQYELFRAGKIRQSQSMLASLLDRVLQNDSEIRSEEQEISGDELPEFSRISKYLQPGGMVSRSTDFGWEFGSLLLSDDQKSDSEQAGQLQLGTARVSNHDESVDR